MNGLSRFLWDRFVPTLFKKVAVSTAGGYRRRVPVMIVQVDGEKPTTSVRADSGFSEGGATAFVIANADGVVDL
jgi:hypothetical protein